jgi:hypothetical protein
MPNTAGQAHEPIRTDELQADVRQSVLELALQQLDQANQQAANERITAQAYAGVAAAIALGLCVARADAPAGLLKTDSGFDDWWWIPLVLLALAFVVYMVSTFRSRADLARDPSEIAEGIVKTSLANQYDAYLLSLKAAREKTLEPQGMLYVLPAIGHALLAIGLVLAAVIFTVV